MSEFVAAALAFPAVLYTIPLLVVFAYWALVILGAVDLEILEGGADVGEIGDVGDVGVDAGGDLDVGGDAEVDVGDAGEGQAHGSALASALSALGLSGVPITVGLSLLVLLGWFFTFVGMQLAGDAGLAGTLIGLGILLGGTVAGVAVTSVVVRPLRPLFRPHHATESRSLVGEVGVLKTQRVDDHFGQLEVIDHEGAALLVQARCPEPNELTRGSQAMIYDWDPRRGVFLVGPLSKQYESFLDWSNAMRRARPRS